MDFFLMLLLYSAVVLVLFAVCLVCLMFDCHRCVRMYRDDSGSKDSNTRRPPPYVGSRFIFLVSPTNGQMSFFI